MINLIVTQMKTFREACGDDIGLKLDINYNFRTDGMMQIAKALTPEAMGGVGIDWLELDTYSPAALRQIRDCAAMPIASLESLMGRAAIKPFLEAGAVDTCIIDPLWNGVDESVKMANLCDMYEVNCAAHNYHGWLGTAICAHFCAAIPNFKVLETDVDDVPWKVRCTCVRRDCERVRERVNRRRREKEWEARRICALTAAD
jgi:L-alanine-DL-glutamate epimerase-like enolase superfamily enzyme